MLFRIRMVLSVGPALFILVTRIGSGQPLGKTLLRSLVAWVIGHLFANALLKRRARIRIRKITEVALPDSLDHGRSPEAGLGLNATIMRGWRRAPALDDPLGDEFSQVAVEIRKAGRATSRCADSQSGTASKTLKALTALIIQNDRLGASMGKTLRAHADVLRTKRRQRRRKRHESYRSRFSSSRSHCSFCRPVHRRGGAGASHLERFLRDDGSKVKVGLRREPRAA